MKQAVEMRIEIPCGLKLAIEYLQKKLAEIPEECRERATLDFDVYGEGVTDFHIRYLREAKKQEIEARRNELRLQLAQWTTRKETIERQLKELEQ